MNYLLDKKIKKKKLFRIAFLVLVFIILIYFRSGIGNALSSLASGLSRPVLIAGNNVGEKFTNLNSYFASKNSLYSENEILKNQIMREEARMANYGSLLAENTNLKEILGRKDLKKNMILSAILSKPNQSPYDTLIIDAGESQGIKMGNTVFAGGNIPIGRIAETYANSSKVILFSTAGERTQAVIGEKSVFMELVGRGGGNFEIIMPRDFVLKSGEQAIMPGIHPYLLAVVETVISDPRDPFTKALLVSPVNIQEIKFVEVAE